MSGYQPPPNGAYWSLRGIPPRVVGPMRWENDRLDQLLRDTGRTFKNEAEAVTAWRAACDTTKGEAP